MSSRRGPDNTVRVAVQGTCNSVNWANIFHAQLATSSSITQSDLDTWNLAFFNAYKTRFLPQMNANVTAQNARTVLYTPGGGELLSVQGASGVGSSGGTAATDNSMSQIVSWLTTVYWRGGKPRSYLPGLEGSLVTAAKTLTAGKITGLTTAANGFKTDVNALTSGTITGTTLGFISFRSGNAERPSPIFYPITGAQVHQRIGTQRRRLGKWLA